MIELRGAVHISNDEASVITQIRKLQVALPAETSSFKGGAQFEVFQQTSSGFLVPRYSPITKILLPRKDEFVRAESSSIGAPNSGVSWAAATPLRDVQIPGANEAEAALRKYRGCIIRGDTGSGKTVVGLNLVYRLQPKRVLILVDQLDIAKQWAERIRQFLPNAKLEYLMPKAEAKQIEKAVGDAQEGGTTIITIATAQSVHRSTVVTYDNPFVCELLICDEVHVFGAPTFMSSIFKVNFARSIGLTATADRKDGLDWVFRQCLGSTTIEFEGEVMDPEVVRMQAPTSQSLTADDWLMAWCSEKREMTWHDKCKKCVFYSMFPLKCGGQLPLSTSGRPEWDKLNRSGFIAALSADVVYQVWLKGVVRRLMADNRKTFFFGESRVFLIRMAEWAIQVFGAHNVGIYLGKAKVAGEPDWVSSERESALSKPMTFCTYGVARKAIDVKQKDTAVFATPISDGRQAAGRVRRTSAGKKTPMVIVPVSNSFPVRAAWRRLEKQFREEGWQIRYA